MGRAKLAFGQARCDGMEPAFFVCTGVFVALVVWGMWSDLVSLTIPDAVSIGLVLGFLLAAVLAGAPWLLVLKHLGLGVAVYVLAAVLVLLNTFGGGDAKMLAVIAIWAGWPMLITLLVWTALLGGLLAVIILIFRKIPLSPGLAGQAWIQRLHRRDKGIPYGLAIGLGSLLLLPRITWWQS